MHRSKIVMTIQLQVTLPVSTCLAASQQVLGRFFLHRTNVVSFVSCEGFMYEKSAKMQHVDGTYRFNVAANYW